MLDSIYHMTLKTIFWHKKAKILPFICDIIHGNRYIVVYRF